MTMNRATSWLAVSAVVLAAGLGQAAAPQWPLWNGKESVADYAKRAGIADVETTLDLGGGVSMKLTLIPAGKYIRGCNPEQVATIEGVRVVIKEADEGCQNMLMWSPRSEVTITKPFYMGVSAVTLDQYRQVMGEAAAQKAEKGARYFADRYKQDMSDVSAHDPLAFGWLQAAWFCQKVSANTGMKVWMPTEAQWEYSIPLIYPHVKDIKPKYCRGKEWIHDNFTHNYFGAPTVDPAGPVCMPEWPGANHQPRSYFDSLAVGEDGERKPFHNGWHGSGGPNLFRVAVAVNSPLGQAEEAKAGNPPRPQVTTSAAVAGPADPKLRVPSGCRAAAGAKAEPYTKSGWAQEIVHEATGMEMVYIPAGSFLMGVAPWVEGELGTDELARYNPWVMRRHPVTLTKGFYMGKTEVTQAQWEKVMGNNPSIFSGKLTEDEILAKYELVIAQHNAGPEAPVEMVSWNDCQAFCQKAGGGLRLPTEAEWEYACRAGTQGGLAGNLDELGWYIENSGGTTHPVGLKKPNAWGLYDMHGNVWEFCQDWFTRSDGSGDAETDPTGPTKAESYERRVVRGGCWGDYGSNFHPAIRNNAAHGGASAATGCRVVITAAGAP
jgi:formylglycine-generating enzyme required for sulfatase activity